MLKRLSTSFLIIVVSLFFAAAPAFAANETVTASDGTVIPVLDREEYSRRVEAFVNDARWQDEAAWAMGDLLYTAEGAYGGKVQIETGFYIVSGDTLVARYGTDYEIVEAYHYPITE